MTDRNDKADKTGPGLADFMPHQATATPDGGYRASAGEARSGLGKVDMIKIEDALKSVHDPEIPVNIFDLGLIYDINRMDDGNIHITMSLTAPGCPVAGEMPGQVAEAVAAIPEAGQVDVDLVWDPPWSKERMSEDAKLALDMVW
jgi:FeS assembly SUF system protein